MRLFEYSGFEFADSVSKVVCELDSRAENESFAFSGKPREGMVYVLEEFRTLILPSPVVEALNCVDWGTLVLTDKEKESLPYFHRLKHEVVSLSDFIEASGGVAKSLSRLEATQRFYYQEHWGLSDEENDQRIIYSFIKCIYGGIQAISSFINKKHEHRNAKDSQDFCVFCWKMVRHNQETDSDLEKKRRESNYYCSDHHPTRETGNYLKAKRALIKAVEDERPEFRNDLERLSSEKMTSESKARMFNKWMVSFAPKSALLTGRIDESISWEELAQIVLIEAKINYSYTYSKIESSLKYKDSWIKWLYYGVLQSLDDSKDKNERIRWQNIGASHWNLGEWKKSGWRVILHLFRRHEAFHYVSNRPRPRGPKVDSERPMTSLQVKIKQEIESYLDSGRKPDVKEIAKTLKVARKTVYGVIHKLK
ncbi:hypothetical protein KW537_14405 [Vibrio fluvialis]|nr:hypothetical protein [Vibrio fluvialis]